MAAIKDHSVAIVPFAKGLWVLDALRLKSMAHSISQ